MTPEEKPVQEFVPNALIPDFIKLLNRAARETFPQYGDTFSFRQAKEKFPSPHSGDFEFVVWRALHLYGEEQKKAGYLQGYMHASETMPNIHKED